MVCCPLPEGQCTPTCVLPRGHHRMERGGEAGEGGGRSSIQGAGSCTASLQDSNCMHATMLAAARSLSAHGSWSVCRTTHPAIRS
jgi:hypothetical protein